MFIRHRIYKSLPLEDFMDHFCFALTSASYYALPEIQHINWIRKVNGLSDEEAKKLFLKDIRRDLDFAEENNKLSKEVSIFDDSRYYEVILAKKDEETAGNVVGYINGNPVKKAVGANEAYYEALKNQGLL